MEPMAERTPVDVQHLVLTIGPCGSSILFVDPTAALALEHLTRHDVEVADPRGRVTAETSMRDLKFYDGRGRTLAVVTSEGVTTLTVADHTDRRDEVTARVDEVFARVRARAYHSAAVLEDAPGHLGPWDVRAPDAPRSSREQPSDAKYDEYFQSLYRLLSARPDIGDHLGSWWHNLFHH